jgi:hypothetical protein
VTYLAEAFGFSMLLKAESGEVNTGAEHLRLRENTDTTNTVNLHLHIWVAVGVAKVGQMGSPGSILCISFNDDSVFVESVGKRKGGLRLLPGVQIVRLLSAEPVR